MLHISDFGPFAAGLDRYADANGWIPEPGDNKEDFDFARNFSPRQWRNFVHLAQEAVEDTEDSLELMQHNVMAGTDVNTAEEESFPLLQPGQAVDTPVGPGTIQRIELHAGKYGDRIELEPPIIMVRLDNPDANPQNVQVCMCKLGLKNGEHEAILSKEFGRLWPPITALPESTHMLTNPMHEKGGKAVIAQGDRVETSDLHPGMVLDSLAGVDWGDQSAVVIDVSPANKGSNEVSVWLVDTEEEKHYLVPHGTSFQAHTPAAEDDAAADDGSTSYDRLRLNEDIAPIRQLPDSSDPFYTDPNHPNSIEQTLWRPTVRRSPVFRYYSTNPRRSQRISLQARGKAEREQGRRWGQQLQETSLPRIDEDGKRRPIRYPQLIGYEPNDASPLADAAVLFFEEYQAWCNGMQTQFIVPSYYDTEAAEFSFIFCDDHGLSCEDMDNVWRYMVEIGLFPDTQYDAWLHQQAQLQPDLRRWDDLA